MGDGPCFVGDVENYFDQSSQALEKHLEWQACGLGGASEELRRRFFEWTRFALESFMEHDTLPRSEGT